MRSQFICALVFLALMGCEKVATPVSPSPPPPGNQPPSQPPSPPPPPLPPPPIGPVESIAVGAGDVGMPGLAVEQTGRLMQVILATNPNAFAFVPGDTVYPHASDENFRRNYDPYWGVFKDRTFPAPGNHDLEEGADPTAYYRYFGHRAGPPNLGRYSFRAGSWLILSLNSVEGSSASQLQMIRSDIESNPTKCTLALYHHPWFSSGQNGSSERMREVWRLLYDLGADVVISAHDHLYERFAPQDVDGRLDLERGIRQFTVGTGGASLYRFVTTLPNSEAREIVHGVLKLSLRDIAYDWEFVSVDGQVRDSGREVRCH